MTAIIGFPCSMTVTADGHDLMRGTFQVDPAPDPAQLGTGS